MPSTPKNPFDGGGSIQGQPNMTIKPKEPAYDGGQYARDVATPEEIMVSHDKYWNEMPSDRTSHMNTTPEHSNPTYVGRQYDTQVTAPDELQYGVMIRTPMVSKEVTTVNPHSADRGRES